MKAPESAGVAQKEAGAASMAWTLLRIWAGIGLQSFGGGASTLLLIRREFVEQRPWVDADEFSRFWNLCMFTPGINLLALTVLIGRKLGGPWGVAASLAGLLLPSATITCLLAAGFQVVRQSAVIHAVLRGVIPATAGIMAVVAVDFARPLLQRGRRDGVHALGLSIAVMLGSAAALIVAKLTVVALLAVVALVGGLVLTPRRAAPAVVADPSPEGEGS